MNRAKSQIFNVQWNVWIWNDQIISSHRKCSFDHRFFALRRPSKPPKWINRANSFAMSLISYNIFCLHNTEICTQHEQIFEMRLNHSDIYLEFDIFERILWWTALMTQLRSTGIPLELSLIFLKTLNYWQLYIQTVYMSFLRNDSICPMTKYLKEIENKFRERSKTKNLESSFQCGIHFE